MTTSHGVSRFSVALLVVLALPAAASGQQSPEEDRSVRDGVYTEEQAERGQRIYETECSLCHGPRDFSGPTFILGWNGQPVGALYSHIRMTMPQDNPGHLSERQYAEVVAYMLQLNDYPSGEDELPADVEELSRIRIERPEPSGR